MRCKDFWIVVAIGLASLTLGTRAGASPRSNDPDAFADALRDDLKPDQTIRQARQALDQIGDQFDSGDYDRLPPSAFSAMGLVALAWSRIGWAKFLQGETLDAIPFLNSAWLLSQSGVVADRLGRVYEKEGQKKKACRFYALAVAAGGPDTQSAREQVTRLSASPDAAIQEIAQASTELLAMRTVKIPASAGNPGTAQFALVFETSGKPSRAEFLEGDSGLRPAAAKIRENEFLVGFPDISSIKLVRHAQLSCAPAGCSVVLQPVDVPQPVETPQGSPAQQAANPTDALPVASPPPSLAEAASAAPSPAPPQSLIERAREAAWQFSQKLPNFVCQEFMSRYVQQGRQDKKPLDLVSAEIIYEDGHESYRNVKIDNHPTDKPLQEIDGSWSTGEFASILLELFHPDTHAKFHSGGASTISGLSAQVYDFQVEGENSRWMLHAGSQNLAAAYQGSVWLDPSTARVLRIEMQARNLPSDFPMSTVETAVDYSYVRIGETSVLLPVHAEALGCQRGSSYCSHNIIDFRNYHEFKSEIKILPHQDQP
ncbi:MAG TPA: hypothetical protein VMB18_13775 [Terriglobales bacterium]|nr:hypothetical protein [Terriglobales bacterium]